jgi:hypothetical protein
MLQADATLGPIKKSSRKDTKKTNSPFKIYHDIIIIINKIVIKIPVIINNVEF